MNEFRLLKSSTTSAILLTSILEGGGSSICGASGDVGASLGLGLALAGDVDIAGTTWALLGLRLGSVFSFGNGSAVVSGSALALGLSNAFD